MKKLSLLIVLCVVALLTSCSFVTTKIDDEKIPVKDDPPLKTDVVPGEDSNNIAEAAETLNVTLYFPDNDALYLHPEQREVKIDAGKLPAEAVIEELFRGPLDENLSRCLDGEDLLLSVKVSDGLCTVDFAEDFKLLNSGGTTRESFAIGAIVNSLCELDGIEKVKINIGGNENSDFGGHFTLEEPFSPQTDLVSK